MTTVSDLRYFLKKILRPFPTFQLQSFLKNIENFLCKWKIVNNCFTPSMHAVRKIATLSDEHFFTLHPSLSPYGRTELQRNKYTCFAWAGGTFSPVVLLCQFSVLAGNRFWFYILLMCTQGIVPYSCGVVLVFFCSGGKQFLVLRCTIQLCGCVSFFVVAGKLIANTGNPTLIS